MRNIYNVSSKRKFFSERKKKASHTINAIHEIPAYLRNEFKDFDETLRGLVASIVSP